MNCLIYFWYRGSFHRKNQYAYVYCYVCDIDLNESEQWNKQQAEETLGCMINGGLIDVMCTDMVVDFKVISIDLNTPYEEGMKRSLSLHAEKWCYLPKK